MDTPRWQQRFQNFCKALDRLNEGVTVLSNSLKYDKTVDNLIKDGVIQRFEFTHELAWKVLKDYAEFQGYTDIRGSRDALRRGLEMGLISDPQWMKSIEARNLTSHDYDEETAQQIYEAISSEYLPLFEDLRTTMIKEMPCMD